MLNRITTNQQTTNMSQDAGKQNLYKLLFQKSFRQLGRCSGICVKCETQLQQNELHCIPLGQHHHSTSYMAVIVCYKCVDVMLPARRVGRKRKSYEEAKSRTKEKCELIYFS